jgi:hypothetical protein
MRFRGALRPILIAALVLTGAVGVVTPAAASPQVVVDRPRSDVVSIFGDAADPVSQGTTRVWRSGVDTVTMTPAGEGVRVVARSAAGDRFEFLASPRAGGLFSNGEFPDASATATADHGALRVISGGRSCAGGSTGHYKILDRSEDQTRLWLIFEQRCAGAAGSMFGEIRMNQENDPTLLMAPMRFEFPAKQVGTDGGAVPITVINSGSAPLTIRAVDIVGAPGYGPLRPVGDDSFGLGGTVSFHILSSTCQVLAPGASCVVLATYRPLLFTPTEAYVTFTDSTRAGKHTVSLAAPSALIAG